MILTDEKMTVQKNNVGLRVL